MKKIGSTAFGSVLALAAGFALALGLALTPAGVSAQDQAAAAHDGPPQIEITILGMSCPFCAYGVEKKLKKLDGVADLEIVLETGLATL
ncbi:MAG: heavy-metal-associated domain-containing protein, partial [Longimicrobiales bacterium]